MRKRSASRHASRRGFTLVELLVVIGIIALLISVLMPALNRAREQANMVKCMSNVRQIGMAFVMYNNENKGRFPGPAAGPRREDDWIHWQAGRNLSQSSINRLIAPNFVEALYQCPSDSVDNHRTPYKFSYTVNWNLCEYFVRNHNDTAAPANKKPVIVVSKVPRPSEKILIIDESEVTVDDGCWAPENWLSDRQNLLANRHARKHELQNDPNSGRGVVGFVDGHCEFLERKESFNPKQLWVANDGAGRTVEPVFPPF